MLIGEVSRRSGVSARMLRHYDALGLVRPTGRSVGGYREYSTEDIGRIFSIESLRSLGLSLREVGRALDDPAFAPAELVDRLIGLTEERIAREQELLARLRGIDVAEPTDWEDVLRVVALLQALGSDDPARRQRAALSAAGDASSPAELLAEAVLHEQDQNVAGALQWALAQAGGEGTAQLAAGLRSPDAEVRRRAVTSIAELPGAEATALLRDALGSGDVVVSRHAALALASRGSDDGLPTLIGMVVDGAGDVEAADALGVLARNPELGERIGTDFSRLLSEDTVDAAVRRRIAQALAEIPGPVASAALARLAQDDDRGVALTASYVLDLRARDRDAAGGGASPR